MPLLIAILGLFSFPAFPDESTAQILSRIESRLEAASFNYIDGGGKKQSVQTSNVIVGEDMIVCIQKFSDTSRSHSSALINPQEIRGPGEIFATKDKRDGSTLYHNVKYVTKDGKEIRIYIQTIETISALTRDLDAVIARAKTAAKAPAAQPPLVAPTPRQVPAPAQPRPTPPAVQLDLSGFSPQVRLRHLLKQQNFQVIYTYGDGRQEAQNISYKDVAVTTEKISFKKHVSPSSTILWEVSFSDLESVATVKEIRSADNRFYWGYQVRIECRGKTRAVTHNVIAPDGRIFAGDAFWLEIDFPNKPLADRVKEDLLALVRGSASSGSRGGTYAGSGDTGASRSSGKTSYSKAELNALLQKGRYEVLLERLEGIKSGVYSSSDVPPGKAMEYIGKVQKLIGNGPSTSVQESNPSSGEEKGVLRRAGDWIKSWF
jgi:hypothetical protein